MKVGILGAGPGGLYLALLLKKLDPRHEVRVVERNPPGATFGWGVVFSEETLGALRDADYETYEQITDSFAKWGAIDVLYRGETVRSRGHVFSGMSRKVLLQLLQRRCEELGSVLEFEREVADLGPFAGCDLVVAADGVFSTVRRRHERDFEPSLDRHRTKYAWFGSDLVFDAFTFVFRDTEHGLFQVHAYPFDARTSTFIVETHESTWRRAGLDQMSEQESLEYCQELFRPELGEHRLLSNRSVWFTFETLRNRNWHHGNVVLLGDAAHTAHFTIGSGTKLAMEDAISLANALQRFPGDLEAALTHYELERQPVVERFQEAARDSATYFENVSRYNRFEPVQFAFNLLTRSGRIGHLELERRDARFVAAVDRWFAGAATGQHAPLLAPPPLFTPFTLGATAVGNRIVLSPGGEDAAVDGQPGEVHERALAKAVRSGAGLVLTEEVAVSAEGRTTPGTPGLYRDEHAAAWRSLLQRARAEGPALLGVRLAHAGRRGATRPRHQGVDRPLRQGVDRPRREDVDLSLRQGVGRSLREGGWPLLAPSALPYTPQHPAPQELTREGMEQVREAYRAAAGRAAEAGFDLLVLDMAHGYLLASFLSPLTNRRQDGYGGPVEQRLRFPLEVLDAVRAAWPAERPVAVRLQASDRAPGGLDTDDAVAVAGRLRGHGCDLVEVAAGWTVPWDRPDYRWLYLVPASDRVRNEAGVPTIAGGNLTTADEVNTILAAGRADLCLLDPRLHAGAG